MALFVIIAITAWSIQPVAAQCPGSWANYFPLRGCNEEIDDLMVFDDGNGPQLAVAGRFEIAGRTGSRGVARWDGRRWSGFYAGIPGYVYCLCTYGSRLIAAGGFNSPGWNIAQWDGSRWQRVGGGVGQYDTVSAILEFQGELYAAGNFRTASGTPAVGIARWNGTQWRDVGGGVGGTSPYARTLSIFQGQVVVGGTFESAGGAPMARISSWDGQQWSPLGAGLGESGAWNSASTSAAYQNELYVGGSFTTAGGVPVRNLARWDGSTWSAVGGGIGGSIYDMEVIRDELWIAGTFQDVDGLPVRSAARWNGLTWTAAAPDIYGRVAALAEFQGSVFAGGTLYSSGTTPLKNFAKLEDGAWVAPGYGQDGVIRALLVEGDDLFVGGDFGHIADCAANRVAQWTPNGWRALGGGLDGRVNALARFGGDLIAAGDFLNAEGFPAMRIARWDEHTWSPLSSGADGAVWALLPHEDRLYAGGEFRTIGGVDANGIAAWDGSSWSPIGGGMDLGVRALAVYQGELFAGGDFTRAGGTPARYIARYDGEQWQPLQPSFCCDDWHGGVYALREHNGILHIGGSFALQFGMAYYPYSAQWNGLAVLPAGTNLDNEIRCFGTFQGSLFASGHFWNFGSSPHIARWNGGSWEYVEFGGVGRLAAEALAEHRGDMVVVGPFERAGLGLPSAYIARWGPGLVGDLNEDNAVDLDDLFRLLNNFGRVDGVYPSDGDLDEDGDVDLSDLVRLLGSFGIEC